MFCTEFTQDAVRRMVERRAQDVSVQLFGRESDVRPEMLRLWEHQLSAGQGSMTGCDAGAPFAAPASRSTASLTVP